MERVFAKDVASQIGKTVTVCGWAHRIRSLGKIAFVVIRDRSGLVQTVFENEPNFTHESVVCVTGEVKENPKAPNGVEIGVSSVQILSLADSSLPLSVNKDLDDVSLDVLLDNRAVSLRNPKILSIFKLQSALLRGFAEFLSNEGFFEIKTSKLIGTATEGGTDVFTVDYFGKKAYLAQSPQLYKQTMVAAGLERVFEIGAAYRAEKHETSRHINELIMLDVEMGFIESELDLIDLEKRLMSYMLLRAVELAPESFALHNIPAPDPTEPMRMPIITHEESLRIASEKSGSRILDMTPEAERVLCAWAKETHNADGVFVNDFPISDRPFYTHPRNKGTMSFDMLFRGVEITSGSRRIHEYQTLVENAKKFGLNPELMEDYLSVFKYGCPPHGGFALGLERVTQKLLGLKNVKEASLFPRDRNRLRP